MDKDVENGLFWSRIITDSIDSNASDSCHEFDEADRCIREAFRLAGNQEKTHRLTNKAMRWYDGLGEDIKALRKTGRDDIIERLEKARDTLHKLFTNDELEHKRRIDHAMKECEWASVY